MRKYPTLTPRRILWLFRYGYYTIINIESHTPEIYAVKKRSKYNTIIIHRHPVRIRHQLCHRGYRHVRLYYKGRRASVALHKLVWMFFNNATVPPAHEVHHIKSKRLLGKCHDGIGNLELLDKEAHLSVHGFDEPSIDLHTEEFLSGKTSDLDELRTRYPKVDKPQSDYPSSWDDI